MPQNHAILTSLSDPFEQAFFVLVYLSYLQPFEDVNKRVSRLAANIPLIRGNLYPFHLRYCGLLASTIAEVVRGCKDKKEAILLITQRAEKKVKQDDLARFVEVVETELMSLHEGNIARNRLRPVEYHAWQKKW